VKRRYYPDRLDAVDIAVCQMEYEGKYNETNKFLAALRAAIDQGAIPVEEKQSAGTHVYQYIRRHDYAQWRKRVGLSPPHWWLIAGETEQKPFETSPSKKGRRTNPKALINRPDELQQAAIDAAMDLARRMGETPSVREVARQLHKQGKFNAWEQSTLRNRLRKEWWSPSSK